MARMARTGGGFTFHGSFTSKLLAKKKEAQTPGSFIVEKNDRYYVLKPKRSANHSSTSRNRKRVTRRTHRGTSIKRSTRHSNPGVLIYEKITRIEGTKGKASHYAGEKFFHNFKSPYPQMWGLPDGSLLIKSKK